MKELRAGKSVRSTPEFANLEEGHTSPKCKEKHWGTVIYIHPLRRFAVLEFSFPAGKVREAFPLDELDL